MSKIIIGIIIAIALVIVGYFFLPAFQTVTSQSMDTDHSQASSTNDSLNTVAASAAQAGSLIVQDEMVGTGETAKTGDTLRVNYTGKFQDGTVFDTSVGRVPFQFTLGAGQVIAGWEQGFTGMKVGGKRLLIVPPQLGYGAQTVGPIPANSTLVFEVELLKVIDPSNIAPIPEGPQS